MKPWLLVFDLDGTLIDSSRDLWASVNASLAHVGRAPLPPEVVNGLIGNGAASLVRHALAAGSETSAQEAFTSSEQLFEKAFAFFLGYYREHKLDTTRPYPGVINSLQTLRERFPELPMAVLTNKPVNPSREICAGLGLAPFFFVNYGGNSFATKKPDPEGLLAIMDEARGVWQRHGVPPEALLASEVIMVGDSEVDVATARNCGTLAMGCLYGLAPEALLRSYPDFQVHSPSEWVKVLDRGNIR